MGDKRGISSAVNHLGDGECRDDTLSLRRVMSLVDTHTHTCTYIHRDMGGSQTQIDTWSLEVTSEL